MLFEPEGAQGAERVGFGDFAGGPAGQQRDQERDQAAYDQRIAVAAKAHHRLAMAVPAAAGGDPHLAGAALDLVFGRALALRKVAERPPEFDEESVTILPVIEKGKILGN